jgi:hypothetical protein
MYVPVALNNKVPDYLTYRPTYNYSVHIRAYLNGYLGSSLDKQIINLLQGVSFSRVCPLPSSLFFIVLRTLLDVSSRFRLARCLCQKRNPFTSHVRQDSSSLVYKQQHHLTSTCLFSITGLHYLLISHP